MATYDHKLKQILQENGCTFVRNGKGDHEIWHSPINGQNFPVDTKIKSKDTANETLKEAGIGKKF